MLKRERERERERESYNCESLIYVVGQYSGDDGRRP